jgi:hypothetical protein
MVDPNRKINLTSSDESEEDELNEEHVKMVKEFEEEFKDRFTENDEEFMNFCKRKQKPPIIVYPFDQNFHRGNSGGRNNYGHQNHRGGRNYHHNNYHNQRNYNNQNNSRNYDNSSSRDNNYRYGDAKRMRRE